MVFKIIVCIFMFLEFLHNWWLEDKIKNAKNWGGYKWN